VEIDRAAYGEVADRIERELRNLGAWQPPEDDPGPPQGAFGAGNQSATQWIQFTLLPRVRAIAAGEMDPPSQSDAGVMAVREFDGYDAADPLVRAVLDLDTIVNNR
jgi:uncharacterized protein YqcC (DUF446 family)